MAASKRNILSQIAAGRFSDVRPTKSKRPAPKRKKNYALARKLMDHYSLPETKPKTPK